MMSDPATNVRSIAAGKGRSAVSGMLADAQPIASIPKSADPHQPREGCPAGQWRSGATALGLPQNCPVVPLGVTGRIGWFLDPIGQVQSLEDPYGKGQILGLFAGDANYLAWAWPRFSGKKRRDDDGIAIDGYAAEDAAADLMRACFAKGPWRGIDKIRGRGLWRDESGAIVVHTGTKIFIGGRQQPPGEIEGHVYPTRPSLPTPWPEPVPEDENPAQLLRPLLSTWNWSRETVDQHLFLGWIGAAYLGDALKWRPTVYLVGDKATGKSTLQELIKRVLGEWLLQTTDTTAAGLYQHIGADVTPIAVDEFEGKSDTRAAEKVLELARQSNSGGVMLRGGDRHNPVDFQARSTFLFSSINTPPLRSQDLSRMAILRLGKIANGGERPNLDPRTLGVVGRLILRRLIEQWPRFAETLDAFERELCAGGMDQRGMDQRGGQNFGTLLACADMIEHDGWNEDRLKVAHDGDLVPWSDLLRPEKMFEFEDQSENWRACLSHLLTVRIDAWRSGTRSTVGQVLDALYSGRDMDETQARTLLAQCGLGLIKRKGTVSDYWLAVPNQSPLVRELFDGSIWAGAVGASVWNGALRQSPHDEVHTVEKQRVNGDKCSCTMLSLQGLYGPDGVMQADAEEEVD